LNFLQIEPTDLLQAPLQPIAHLDALWIQVAGTACNLTCTHCFVSCGPGDLRHRPMTRHEVRDRVEEGLALGVREFYFTGGEPFLHPDLLEILADTLAVGPATVLTNGTLFTPARLERLRDLSAGSRYAFELRVSLDGYSESDHDRFRGSGSFARTIGGLRAASRVGLLPIVTATQTTAEDPVSFRARYLTMLRAAGIERPRLKVLPLFRLGREAERDRPYSTGETLAGLPQEALAAGHLQCGSCRAVTANGVYVCPLLIEEPRARMADRIEDALTPFRLAHGACSTCWETGMTCANA
jgi:AdoMet-dependent heme synthase